MHALRLTLFASLVACCSVSAQTTVPDTPRKPVTDGYRGVKVVDDYRWLEDWSDPATQKWSNAENLYARHYLDALPGRDSIRKQLQAILSKTGSEFSDLVERGGRLFALRQQPPKEQAFLIALRSADELETARVICDPTSIDPQGHAAIDFYVPSQDGKYVAVSISKGGSENGDLHVFDTETGEALKDVIPDVNKGTAGGSVAWISDGSGFYYTRYPRPGERPVADMNFYQQIWFHRLGTDITQDTYSLGKDFPRIAEITMTSSEDGRYILAKVANGDGGEYMHYLSGPDGKWIQIGRFADEVVLARVAGGSVYFLSRQQAPRGKIEKASLEDPRVGNARAIIPEGSFSIDDVVVAGKRIYVAGINGGPSVLRIYDTDGRPDGEAALEPNSAVGGLVSISNRLLFRATSYVTPPVWCEFNPATRQVRRTQLQSSASANSNDIKVERKFAISKDGTKIPLSIVRRNDTPLNSANPTLLAGYGGYGVSIRPMFTDIWRPLLDRGVVLAIANLRGGGEYGEEWHLAGKLTRKQNVFDDFESCARLLINERYTSPQHLAIQGGSNGGLLMGAAFTQHPELYRAVVSSVGIYDMLRVELSPNGSFNVTEFGTVKEADQFRALFAYSPYHHVVNKQQYPAILFMTGANDPRVDPMNSRKMTARLQATQTKNPVLLRTSGDSGHGIGTSLSETIEELVDVDSFLIAQWGLK